jgi:hypothetical protein
MKSKEQIVTTINGDVKLRSECRLIEGEYYLIGDINVENSGDVYNIDGRYIRFSTNRIVFDHYHKQYKLKNSSLTHGIINFEDKQPVFGYFTSNDLYNVQIQLENFSQYVVMSEDTIPLTYREERSTGIYYHISLLPAIRANKIKNVDKRYKESLPYDSKGITDGFAQKHYANYKPIIHHNVSKYASALRNLTFGLEFETVKGIISNNKLNVLPLIPLRDGSIPGIEYVTIPLSGELGIQALLDSITELSKRTEYDDSCALHLHIGNIPRTPEFILAFYKVMSYFEDEMYEMFPLYKKYNFDVKRKNYSKPFPINKINSQLEPSIDIDNTKQLLANFNILFKYFSEGENFSYYDNNLKNVHYHPRDADQRAKWNINTRYHAVNFVPLMFVNKQTIEFRIHTPTYDHSKIMNFLLLNSFLINFTMDNTRKILKEPTLLPRIGCLRSFIDSYVYESLPFKENKSTFCEELRTYVSYRKQLSYEQKSRGSITGDESAIIIPKNFSWIKPIVSVDKALEGFKAIIQAMDEIRFNINNEPVLGNIEMPIVMENVEVHQGNDDHAF